MIVPAVLAAAGSVQMTFICTPADEPRRTAPYVVSFERNADRLRRIWVIWPSGRQSDDDWKGRVVADRFVIRSETRSTVHELTLKLNSSQERASFTQYFAIVEGHLPMQQTDEAECTVRTVDILREAP